MNPLQQRHQIVDAIRGVAILGILLMNIPYFALPEITAENLNIRNEYHGINYYVWFIIEFFFEGSMRGLFSLLFGASMVLLTMSVKDKSDGEMAADIYYRRLIWLLLFGLFDAFVLVWPGDILFVYALCGMFLFPFRKMRPAKLLTLAGFLLVLLTVKINWDIHRPLRLKKEAQIVNSIDTSKTKLTPSQKETVEKWNALLEEEKHENKLEAVKKETKILRGSFKTVYDYLTDIAVMFQTQSMYRRVFLDCFILMLIGIAFFHLGIITGKKSMRFYFFMSLIAYAIALPLAYWKINLETGFKFDRISILEHSPLDFYEIRRLALTIGHLGLIILLYKSGFFKFFFKLMEATGKMAFTNYLMQSIICGYIFNGYGLAMFDQLERYQVYEVLLCVWAVQITYSFIWLKYFKMGPFEWLWRSLTYWEWQSIKK